MSLRARESQRRPGREEGARPLLLTRSALLGFPCAMVVQIRTGEKKKSRAIPLFIITWHCDGLHKVLMQAHLVLWMPYDETRASAGVGRCLIIYLATRMTG